MPRIYNAPEITQFGDINRDAWGRPKVINDFSIFSSLFTFDVPPTKWILEENGTEVSTFTQATSVNGALKLSSSTNNSYLSARRHPRYQSNRGQLCSMSMWFPSPDADGVRDFGFFSEDDGVFFRVKPNGGTGSLYAVLRRGGVEVREELITMPFTIDLSKGNIFDIQMQWRGVGNHKFFVGNPNTGTSQLVHMFHNLNTLTTLSTEDPAPPVAFQSTYTTAAVDLYCGCVDLTSEGGHRDREQYQAALAESVSVNGTDAPVIVIKQPDQINSRHNSRDIRLARIAFNLSKKGTFKVWTTRAAADITGATFKVIGGGSYIETDSTDMDATAVRATSVTTANMRFITAVPVEATSRTEVDNPSPQFIDFFLVHGDYLVITCTATTATADVVVEWGEEV